MKKFVSLSALPSVLPPASGVPVSSATGSGNPSPLPTLAPVMPAVSIPTIQSKPDATNATGQRQFQRFAFPIPSGGAQSFPIAGSTVFVELLRTPFRGSASAEYAATAQPDTGPVFPLYEGGEVYFDAPFNSLQIRNLTGGDAFFVLWIGFGSFSHPIRSTPRTYEFGAAGAAIVGAVHAAGNIVTIGNIDPPPYPFTASRLVRLRMAKVSIGTASLRAFIFSGQISAATGANIPFTLLEADEPQLQAIVDFPAFITAGAGSTISVCEVSGISVPVSNYYADNNFSAFDPLAGSGLFVVVVAVSAYTSPGENCYFKATFLPN